MVRAILIFVFLGFQLILFAQERTVGTVLLDEDANGGYTLFSPAGQGNTYLINNCGQIINTWESLYSPGASVYLLRDGSIMRSGTVTDARLGEPGVGGVFERINWDGEIIWNWTYSNDFVNAHHDFHVRENGNILIIAWELKTKEEAIEAGRDPGTIANSELWPDHIIEIEQRPNNSSEIVWEWHVWDHLVQDFDETKNNYGVVGENPGKIDINYWYTDGADWNHLNSIYYNEDNELIVLSSPFFNEIWIVDRKTTTEEAKGPKGDLLYRWGNPAAYDQGTAADQKLFFQHNAEIIEEGLPNAGNLIIFNNGRGRTPEEFSTVDILDPYNEMGEFIFEDGSFGPSDLEFSYQRNKPTDLYASFISGAQMLTNGNLFITNGPKGTFLEVDFDDNEYWKYVSPISTHGVVSQGDVVSGNLVFKAIKYADDYLNFEVNPQLTSYIEDNPIPLDQCSPLLADTPSNNVTLYPNPVKERLVVNINFEQLIIVDALGTKLNSFFSVNGNTVDVSHLKSGIYYLIIDDKKTIKILKK